MKTVKYSASSVGRDPKNKLVDIHKSDETWYFNTLVDMLGKISELGQTKEYAWDELIKRRPKTLLKGKTGPNSFFSLVSGLLYNYLQNTARYGVCRLSERQMADFEIATMFFHALDNARFEPVTFQEALFDINGNEF